ncbi:FHA domain-containing protein [Methanobrevibacter sp.]|uniref:FHA domain-containing protein n=1 Tax=Methanobrevibacter sp. TaxID=66852 RepID=UPI0026E096CE|nr:FHA domain-containing protein [Methanobrevibacter sp.]MDO5860739.1 FHA domain-containing protein [Methanobrevibacter sp.]
MSDLEMENTVVLDSYDSNIISVKLAAVNNKVRFSILEILRDFKKKPLYSREINSILLNKYNIEISVQMLGQHIKQLLDADLIEEISVKKEVVNKIGRRNVKGYLLKEDAFEDLFLEITFLSDEVFTFFDLHKSNLQLTDSNHCALTIFNGVDKGKTFKIHKDDVVQIGRKDQFDEGDFDSPVILLDNEYSTVSNISKPHIKIFYKDDAWYVLDDASSNGTFIGDVEILKGKPTKIRSNSFIKLSRGNGGAVIYCSF